MRWVSSARRRAPLIGMLVASLLASSAVLLLGSVDKAEAASVDSISPTSGTALGGDTLTISGSGFKSDLGDYVALPYIQFYKDTSNSMYPLIDTGVQLNAATEVTVTYMVTGYNQQNVWGAKGDTTEIALVSGDASSNSGAAFQSFINGSTTLVTQFASIAQSSGILKVTAGNGSVSASLLTPASDPTTGWVQSGSHTFKPVGDDANIIVGSRQTGYFTGRIYSFSIVNGTVGGDTTVSFNGVPAYGPYTNPDTHVTSNQYGLYDTVSNRFFANTKGGNELIEGQIWGPSGSGGAAPTPPTINVSFSGMAGGSSVSKPCQSLTIVSTTQATCTVPASMLDGDGSGVANVTVTVTDASGPTVGTFNYTYENDKPALLSVAPEKGPMTGGSVTLTGEKFVTLLDSLQFGGVNIDPPPGTRPAAWTVNDATVYGFVDPSTGALTPAAEGDGVVGILKGQVVPVEPTTVEFGQADATSVTVTSPTTMTVNAPPQDPATVTVSMTKSGFAASLADAYTYVAVGTLQLTIEGWVCPENTKPEDVQTPVCQVIPNGGYVATGTTVTWLYTVTYVSVGLNGDPLSPSLGQLTDVSVTDPKLDGQVCTVDVLPLNTPYPCVASGPVVPD